MKRLWNKGAFFQEASKKNHVALILISMWRQGVAFLSMFLARRDYQELLKPKQ